MLLISRISRLFRADLHAVLDRIEEPEALLRQAIREMEELLAQDEQRSRLLQEEQRQLTSRQNKLEHELDQIKGKRGEHPENAWSIADYRAQKANERIAEKPENIDFYHAKIRTAEFYFERIFPKVRTLGKTMMANPQSLMRITSEQF